MGNMMWHQRVENEGQGLKRHFLRMDDIRFSLPTSHISFIYIIMWKKDFPRSWFEFGEEVFKTLREPASG
jgi:hypothetical protein